VRPVVLRPAPYPPRQGVGQPSTTVVPPAVLPGALGPIDLRNARSALEDRLQPALRRDSNGSPITHQGCQGPDSVCASCAVSWMLERGARLRRRSALAAASVLQLARIIRAALQAVRVSRLQQREWRRPVKRGCWEAVTLSGVVGLAAMPDCCANCSCRCCSVVGLHVTERRSVRWAG